MSAFPSFSLRKVSGERPDLKDCRVRLKADTTTDSSSKDEFGMLANRFSECQCGGDCVRVGVLTFSHRIRHQLPEPHARLVSPQSFPQLWKKLWKFHEIGEPARVGGQLSRYESLGTSAGASRDEGQQAQLLHVVQANKFRRRRSLCGDGPRPYCARQRLSHLALLGSDYRGYE